MLSPKKSNISRVYVNGRFLSQSLTGVQRFAYEICMALIQGGYEFKILVPKDIHSSNKEIEERCISVGKRDGTLWEQLDLVTYLKKHEGVLLNLCNTAPIRLRGYFTTIHDLGVFQNANWYSRKFALWYKFMTPRVVRNSKGVFTVSETVKEEIQHQFSINTDQVKVIYNGLSEVFKEEGSVEKENIFLHVGTLSSRKNITSVIEAFKQSETQGYKLIFCGGVDENLKEQIGEQTNKIEFYQNLSDEELVKWYRKARFLISASHYEGFGIPVLEGMAQGSIPILSDIPVYRELFNESGVFFDPNSVTDLKKCIEEVIKVTPEKKGDKYLSKYTYERSADELWKVINK